MKLWEDFHPRVMPWVLGCAIPVVDNALIDVAREFCMKTKRWEQENATTGFSGFSRFDFDVPVGAEIVQVENVTVGGIDYDVKPLKDIPSDWATNPPDDNTLYHDNQTECLIFPAPSSTDAISMTLVLQPKLSGTGVSDEVFDLYAETIAAGARSKLQRMPRQPWSDMQQAQIDGLQFMSQMNAAANLDFMRTKAHRVKKAGL
jgi:hypothetical protein